MYAIALTRSKRPDESIAVLTKLQREEERTDLLAINLALAQSYLAAGEPVKARRLLDKQDEIYPGPGSYRILFGEKLDRLEQTPGSLRKA